MPYPGSPTPDPLPRFRGTAGTRQTPEQREALLAFVVEGYREGRSIRDLAALTDRSPTAIRRALAQGGVTPRGRGAPRLRR